MQNTSLLPFESVKKAAESLTDPRSKSQLLAELARSQLLTKQFDAALQTFATISSSLERRVALLTADYQSFPPEKIESLLQLLETDPRTKFLAGNLALSMVEAKNIRSAWKLIETAPKTLAFESEQQRYDFLEKVLVQIDQNDWEKVLRFHQTFTEEPYSDWAALAVAKYLTGKQRDDEAEKFINSLSAPLRRSWAYWEIGFFDQAVNIIETVAITSDDEAEMEKLAIQLRIFGRAAFQRGNREKGAQLLERSESAIISLSMPMQRHRLQCFLGKVLVELQQIGSIRDYVPMETMLESLTSCSDRSRALVWLAEAGWHEGWGRAIEKLAVPERGMVESDRAEQIANVLKRCVAYQQGFKTTGDPSEDAVRISGEEFETLYFSPFAKPDCGC